MHVIITVHILGPQQSNYVKQNTHNEIAVAISSSNIYDTNFNK